MGEAVVEVDEVFVAHEQLAAVAEPADGLLDVPALAVPSQPAAVLFGRSFSVLAVGTDQLDARFRQSVPQRITVRGPVVDQSWALLVEDAFYSRGSIWRTSDRWALSTEIPSGRP